MDFLTKDLVNTFYYSNINNNRSDYKEVVINGRHYYKYGQHQVVTMVGNLYKCYDPSVESYKYMLMVGVAKQHPRDLKITKQEGYEAANEKAYSNPTFVMNVEKDFSKEDFMLFSDFWIYHMMTLELVKTPDEIKNEKNDCN